MFLKVASTCVIQQPDTEQVFLVAKKFVRIGRAKLLFDNVITGVSDKSKSSNRKDTWIVSYGIQNHSRSVDDIKRRVRRGFILAVDSEDAALTPHKISIQALFVGKSTAVDLISVSSCDVGRTAHYSKQRRYRRRHRIVELKRLHQ